MSARAAWLVLVVACSTPAANDPPPEAAGGQGGAPGQGGEAGQAASGGGGAPADLGWPLDDALPEPCAPLVPGSGAAWQGWANTQHPPTATAPLGEESPKFYGRTWQAGATDDPGQAPGWEAEIALGPYGSLPTGEGRCWQPVAASFNVDAGNDDEYQARVTAPRAGLFGVLFRYRPPGGEWRWGDLDGSDNGVAAATTAVLFATAVDPAPLVVVTLNLRCRFDDWAARLPLVVAALARIDPDLVAFQEDCGDADGDQAAVVAAALGAYTRRGYQTVRSATHQAELDGHSYSEGVSILSAHPLDRTHVLALPHVHFPRKALAADVVVRGKPLRFYATHLDYGADAAGAREAAAQAIAADLPAAGAAIIAGDFNTEPDSPPLDVLTAQLTDVWPAANPSQTGLTMPAHAPERRIDYLLVSLPGAPLLGAKLLDEQAAGTLLSDHLGVAAAFSWR